MSRILVVDDDELIRMTVVRVLRGAGYEVFDARDGNEGLALASTMSPDLVISDVNMPGMDGFAMLDAMRGNNRLAGVPVIMLTTLDDRANFRRGMQLGADDYLPKPFSRDELLEAVAARVRKQVIIELAIAQRVAQRESELKSDFADRLAGRASQSRILDAPADSVTDRTLTATVLYADIRGFTEFAERLTATEVAALLSEFFGRASEPLIAHGGSQLRFVAEGVLALFEYDGTSKPAMHSARAALEMALVAQDMRASVQARFGARGVPEFTIGVGLAQGEVLLTKIGNSEEIKAIGSAVQMALYLKDRTKELGWTVAATESVRLLLGRTVRVGASDEVRARGKPQPVRVHEILGFEDVSSLSSAGVPGRSGADALMGALRENAEATARAVKRAYDENFDAIRNAAQQGEFANIRFKGYRIEKKIGAGGMSEVFLATRESDGEAIVLKVLDMRSEKRSMLERFLQEYNMVSKISHPNVVRIYDQGITEDYAFIAMEYFDAGDLRALVKSRPSRAQALSILVQSARALSEIHKRGIVHRDLKPENLMMRQDGTVALADFGIAKGEAQASLTHHDHIVGTPYYLSPEQATSGNVSGRSDLYSLGVILYELLMGRKPYRGNSIAAIIGMHISAPIPKLSEESADLQFLIDKMMAKKATERFESAQALIDAVEAFRAARPAS